MSTTIDLRPLFVQITDKLTGHLIESYSEDTVGAANVEEQRKLNLSKVMATTQILTEKFYAKYPKGDLSSRSVEIYPWDVQEMRLLLEKILFIGTINFSQMREFREKIYSYFNSEDFE